MKRMVRFAVVVLPISAVLAAQPPTPQTKTPPVGNPPSPTYPTPAAQKSDPALDQIVKGYESAFNRGDAKALAALYADNAIRLGPKNEVLHGRAAIEQFYAGSLGGKPGTLSVRPVRTQMIIPDVAVLEGRYEVAGTTGVHGVYVVTVVRQGGQWKFASVVAVPDAP